MLYIMIKPVSGQCNLRCKYCFYLDEAEHREVASYGSMSVETLRNIVNQTCRAAEQTHGACTFVFQGGEPTLRGLPFYRELVRLQEPYRKRGLTICNTIQTNGMLLDEEWAQFLARYQFLVGLSLDGTEDTNDALRVDANGRGSYARIRRAAACLDQAGVSYNIVTVISKDIAKSVKRIYNDYSINGWNYLQFIPCLDPYGEIPGESSYSLTPAAYGDFLCGLFDCWYEDVMQGKIVYIRYFENILGMLLGFQPESCGVCGVCAKEYVVEADGSVYPCDFYVMDEYRLGNFNEHSFAQMDAQERKLGFIARSLRKPPECESCQWRWLCNGGCIRNRDNGNTIGSNYFCASFRQFFEYTIPRFQEVVEMIREKHDRLME